MWGWGDKWCVATAGLEVVVVLGGGIWKGPPAILARGTGATIIIVLSPTAGDIGVGMDTGGFE